MNTRKFNIAPAHDLWLTRMTATLGMLALLLLFSAPAFAQSSVEKAETSKQAQEQTDELARAQSAVAKPNEKPEPPKTGSIIGNYSVTSSIELGYRWSDTNGSRDKYLSDINIRDGFRVFDFTLDSRSYNGEGALYDSMRAQVTNSGGDPVQYYSFSMDKARAYKFDGKVSRMYFYRFLPIIALGQHNYDLRRQISDFNLKLFPQRAVRFNLGYGRSMSVGPYQTTYDIDRDEFPINGRSRWESNDYKAGVDASYKGWNFFLEGFYRNFKLDNTFDQNPGTNIGNNTTNSSVLTFFTRDEPNRSRSVIGRGSIQGDITSRIHLLVRGMKGDEFLRARLFEPTQGTDQNRRTILQRNIIGEGNAKRPSANFDAGLTFDVSDSVAINNTFRYTYYRILGDLNLSTQSRLRATNGTITDTTTTSFDNRFIDLSSYWNTIDFRYAPSRKFSLNAGWRFTRRNIELARPGLVEDDTLTTNTGIFGLRFRPVDRLNLFFDYENGTTDNIFVRINALDFQRIRARANLQVTDTLSFSGTIATTDNKNPTPFVENESDFRSYSISMNWEPSSRLWIAGGYNYDDLFSQANIAFFANRVEVFGRSVFYSRQNFLFADSRLGVTKFLDLFLVYRYVQDRGAPSSAAGNFTGTYDFIANYPLRRHNPEARIAVHLNNRVTANVSYRHFSYNEKGLDFQDYRANIVTSSVRFTF